MDLYPDPALVGKAFVKQYYTQMHRDPTQMHRFYLDHSSYVHGGSEMGSEEPVIGQKAIHEKISSLDLQQVHAKIKQLDSHATLGNGIVVQVTGELSISGQPMRAFVQTFVLAPEKPKKYYVHNDIFRYQDDDLVSESETNEAPGEGENLVLTDQPVNDSGDYRSEKDADNLEVVVTEEGRGMYDSQSAELGDAGVSLAVEEGTQPSTELTSTAWGQYVEPTHLGELNQNGMDVDNTTTTPQAMPNSQEFPSATEPVEVRQDEVSFPMEEAQEQNSTVSTWASRLAPKQQQGSTSNRPHNSTAIPTSQALPQREQRPKRTDHNNRPSTQPSSTSSQSLKDSSKKSGGGVVTTRDAPDTWQIFVGGLPPNTSEAELTGIFSTYGKTLDVRVNPKNFAFVVFDTPDAVQAVMTLKDPIVLRGKSLNIEQKRSSSSRSGGRGDRDRDRDRDRNRGGGQGSGSGKPRGGKLPKR